jgi:hypothetical protein
MIVLCYKEAYGTTSFHREFLLFYLSKTGEKATVANEVWDNWRFALVEKFGAAGEKRIPHLRGFFQPEDTRLHPTTFEELPGESYDEEVLFEKTQSLVKRRGPEIDFFITPEPEKYAVGGGVPSMTIGGWVATMMVAERGIKLYHEFSEQYPADQVFE